MNNKTKTILGLVAFALILFGAVFAYNALSKTVKPGGGLISTEEPGKLPGSSQIPDSSPNPVGSPAPAVSESPVPEKVLAPDFTALDKDGNEVKLSDLIGKPLVLNFWASWCPPCKGEMPHFNTVYDELSEDVTFVMVDMVDGGRETMEKGKKHIEDSGFTFPVYYDTDSEAAIAYGVSSLPTTYFVDKDGYVITGAKGAIDEETLRLGISMAKGETSPQG